MSDEPTTREQVCGALERTVRRGSARVEFRFHVSLDEAFVSESGSMRPQGGSVWSRLTTQVGAIVSRMLRWGLPRLLKRLSKTMAEGMVGTIDFEASRCVYYPAPSKAEMIVGDRRWYGAPGTTIEGVAGEPASDVQPLWLIDLVRGVVDAREEGAESLGARRARRFSAHADLDRAAEAVGYEMAVPSDLRERGDPKYVAVEVWVDDDGYIRRIRRASGDPGTAMFTSTLDLTEFGIALPSDWSRIPAS